MPTTKRKPSKSVSKIISSPAKAAPVKRKADPMAEIAALARESPGWDPRITRYFLSDDKKLKEIMGDKDSFTAQSPSQMDRIVWEGYEAIEVGAQADPVTRVNTRIVKVTAPKNASQ